MLNKLHHFVDKIWHSNDYLLAAAYSAMIKIVCTSKQRFILMSFLNTKKIMEHTQTEREREREKTEREDRKNERERND